MKTKISRLSKFNLFEQFLLLVCLSLWPVSLMLVSTNNLLIYFIPELLILAAYFFYYRKISFWPILFLCLPFTNIKLLPLPLLFITLYLFFNHFKKLKLIYLFGAISLLIIFLPNFRKQSIFVYDYEANQSLIRKIYLYPNIYLARFSQNKINLYFDKATNNFFGLIDPNNYFFAFHPREIISTNHNLNKYPFPSLIFVLFGLYYFLKHPQFKFIASLILGSIINLSLLNNYDLADFILYLPLSLTIVYGAQVMKQKNQKIFYLTLSSCIIITIFELPRLFLAR